MEQTTTQSADLSTMEIMAEYDLLIDHAEEWLKQESPLESIQETRALFSRACEKVKKLKSRLDAPLVVATFGGSGTGKSSLVNVLVGQKVSKSGRERPTTREPVCVIHAEMDLSQLPIAADQCEIHRVRTPLFQEIVLIDCPDPNTSEGATRGSNLEILRSILPVCDVLIYVSTQQQYKSARVTEELATMSSGCRLVFVQTHADLDQDIREDWCKLLSPKYSVPEMFFVDTKKAEGELERGEAFTGETGRLQLFLLNQFASAQRGLIRSANGLDLLDGVLEKGIGILEHKKKDIDLLEKELSSQQDKITHEMTRKLKQSLSENKNLWEKRLLGEVGAKWGSSPFAMALRVYHGLGNILASAWLFRARNTAQIALIGAVQGTRWLYSRNEEKSANERMNEMDQEMVDQQLIKESWLLLTGYLHQSGFPHRWIDQQSLEELHKESMQLGRSFMTSTIQKIDLMIEDLSRQNSGLLKRAVYESLFGMYLIFILYRIGRNFFFVSFWDETKILSLDFYIPSLIFFLLWSAILLMTFSRQLGKGVSQKIEDLARQMVNEKLNTRMFPRIEREIRKFASAEKDLRVIRERVYELKKSVNQGTSLGGRIEVTL